MEGLWLLAAQWDPEDHRDLYLLLGQECQATYSAKELGTWSWQEKRRDLGLKLRGAGGEGEEENLIETEEEEEGGRRTGELLMIETGGIAETSGGGGKAVEGGIITGEKGNGRKMMGGEGEEEGGRTEEEVKDQGGVGRGAERGEELMTGLLILLLEVITFEVLHLSGSFSSLALVEFYGDFTSSSAQALKTGVMERCLTEETPFPSIFLSPQRG